MEFRTTVDDLHDWGGGGVRYLRFAAFAVYESI